jgi:triacylglycerol lipase
MKRTFSSVLAGLLLVLSSYSNAGWFSKLFNDYYSYAETKHPIMLVPGIFAFDTIASVDYWYQIPSAIESRGGEVYVARINAFEN